VFSDIFTSKKSFCSFVLEPVLPSMAAVLEVEEAVYDGQEMNVRESAAG
jgi:hypothetical protein